VAKERKIAGYEILLQKQSAVDASGNLRQDPIDGVLFRAVRPVPHEDGNVAEVARAAWPEVTALLDDRRGGLDLFCRQRLQRMHVNRVAP